MTDVDALRRVADDVYKRCGVPMALIRAYVWSVHRGIDPRPALLRRWFGTSDHDHLGPGAIDMVEKWVREIGRTGVRVPRVRLP